MSKEEDSTNTAGGIGFIGLLIICLIVVKSLGVGALANASWWWCAAPLLIPPIAIVLVLLVIGLVTIVPLVFDTITRPRRKRK